MVVPSLNEFPLLVSTCIWFPFRYFYPQYLESIQCYDSNFKPHPLFHYHLLWPTHPKKFIISNGKISTLFTLCQKPTTSSILQRYITLFFLHSYNLEETISSSHHLGYFHMQFHFSKCIHLVFLWALVSSLVTLILIHFWETIETILFNMLALCI